MINKRKHSNYQDRITKLQAKKVLLKKNADRLAIGRGLTILSLVAFTVLYLNLYSTFYLSLIPVLSLLFIFLVVYHRKIENRLVEYENLIKLLKNEIRDFHNEPNIFTFNENLWKSEAKAHDYLQDLNIVGPFSLLELLNRTTTFEGAQILMNWLKAPATSKEIYSRQAAIKDLMPKTDFVEQFLLQHFSVTDDQFDTVDWLDQFKKINRGRWIRVWTIPAFVGMITCFFMGLIHPLFYTGLALIATINALIANSYLRKVNFNHQLVSTKSKVYEKYKCLLEIIDRESFDSKELRSVKGQLKDISGAKKQLNLLKKLVEALDVRLNIMVAVPLNILFLYDVNLTLRLQDWVGKNKGEIPKWLQTIGKVDAFVSLANLSANNDDWIFPTISDEVKINAKEVGHPLIESSQNVTNDYRVEGSRKIDLITGANMAGKSTFLRTLGINMVLAYAGSSVKASEFSVPILNLFTYMQIMDDLNSGLSTFNVELKRIEKLLENSAKQETPYLFLLDELLRGTNQIDRHEGSVKLVDKLLENGSIAIIATHDLELAKLETRYPKSIRNFHFDMKEEMGKLVFDYKLKEGIISKTNAAILLNRLGL